MDGRKEKLNWFGKELEVTEIEIKRRAESVSEFELADGSTIRFAAVVTAVLRVDDYWDAEGNPFYIVRNVTGVTPMSVPDALKRKPS